VLFSAGVVIDGHIRVNGRPLGDYMHRLSGFMHQEDLFVSTLTVQEHLTFMVSTVLRRRRLLYWSPQVLCFVSASRWQKHCEGGGLAHLCIFPGNLCCYLILKCRSRWPRGLDRVGLRPLACWDRGFESHRGRGRLSLMSVVCCQLEVFATG
jgi:hypothetical protein